MSPIAAATIILGLFALGEVASILSRARIPAILIAFATMFVLLKTGVVPGNIVAASTLTVVGTLFAPSLFLHMGTLIPMRVLRQQYRAVLIAGCGMIGATALIAVIVTPIFGYHAAVAGTGPITGGLLAYVNTTKGLTEHGLNSLLAIPLLVFVLQQFVGLPIVVNLLRRHALKVRDSVPQRELVSVGAEADSGGLPAEPSTGESHGDDAVEGSEPERRLLLPERFRQSTIMLLFMVFAGGALGVWLDSMTGIDYSIWCLGFGIAGAYCGIYPTRALERANGFTVALVGLLAVVLGGLNTITVHQIVEHLGVVVAITVLGTIGMAIGGYLGSRLVGWDPLKGMPVALTALLGFPLDFLVTQEVSRSVGRDERERKEILDDILAPMLIGGFTTVTVGSVVIASILVSTL